MAPGLIDTYVGIIWDVDPGNMQIVICREGLLGLHASLLNRLQFASRYLHGAPYRLDADRLVTREQRRVYSLLCEHTIEELAAADPQNFLIRRETLREWSLHYRVIGVSLYLDSIDGSPRRIFRWTPSVNPVESVRYCLYSAYPDLSA